MNLKPKIILINFVSIDTLLKITYTYFYDKYLKYFEYNIEHNFLYTNKDEYTTIISGNKDKDLKQFLLAVGFIDHNRFGFGEFRPQEIGGILDDEILNKIVTKRNNALNDVLNLIKIKYKVFPEVFEAPDQCYRMNYMYIKVIIYRTDWKFENLNKLNKLGAELTKKRKTFFGRLINLNYIIGNAGFCAKHKEAGSVMRRKIYRCPKCHNWAYYSVNDGYHNGYCDYCNFNWHEETFD